MFSGAQIKQMQDDAARKAARAKKAPYVFWNAKEVDAADRLPLPFIGHYVAPGWVPVEDAEGDPLRLFADTSGVGGPDEPALTEAALRYELKQLVKKAAKAGKTYGFAITEVGQFQAYVGVFVKEGRS